MPSLTPAQLRDAQRLQRGGLLLREIAARLEVSFEAVCLGLYGGNGTGSPKRLASSPERGARKGIQEGPVPGSPGGKGMMAEDQRVGAPEAQDGQTTRPVGNKSAPTAGPSTEGGVDKTPAKPVGQAGAPDASTVQERLVLAPADPPRSEAAEGNEAVLAAPEPQVALAPRSGEDANRLGDPVPTEPSVGGGDAIADERDRLAFHHHAATRFVLRSPDGQTLHQGEHVLTRLPSFFWRGTAEQVAVLKRKKPQWQHLKPEAVR